MTTEELQAIKERCEKATAGGWSVEHYIPHHPVDDSSNSFFSKIVTPVESDRVIVDGLDWRPNRASDDPGPSPNADFIAHARTDLPDALDEIRRLREENRLFRQIVADEKDTTEEYERMEVEIKRLREELTEVHKCWDENIADISKYQETTDKMREGMEALEREWEAEARELARRATKTESILAELSHGLKVGAAQKRNCADQLKALREK